eukprot:525664-Prymnesium_polylepis.1
MATSSPAWYAMFAVGQIPAGISNCYKQKCLKGVDLEVMCKRRAAAALQLARRAPNFWRASNFGASLEFGQLIGARRLLRAIAACAKCRRHLTTSKPHHRHRRFADAPAAPHTH